MHLIRGVYRSSLGLLLVMVAAISTALGAVVPLRVGNVTLSMWLLGLFYRPVLRVLNVKVTCTDLEKLQQHQGIVMANHISYVDVLALASLIPVRFLAKAEIRYWPGLGMAAKAIGCVFVQRHDKQSREEARRELAQMDHYPPIVIFPEGTRPSEPELLPFRYGGFRVAIDGEISILPCAVVYDAWDVLRRREGEPMPQTMWRLTTYKGPIHAEIIPLEVIEPSADNEAPALARKTQEKITAVLQRKGGVRQQP